MLTNLYVGERHVVHVDACTDQYLHLHVALVNMSVQLNLLTTYMYMYSCIHACTLAYIHILTTLSTCTHMSSPG